MRGDWGGNLDGPSWLGQPEPMPSGRKTQGSALTQSGNPLIIQISAVFRARATFVLCWRVMTVIQQG